MSDKPASSPPGVRPMTTADYAEGEPVREARQPAALTSLTDHPTRDLVLGAVVGAAALWAVPKALDLIASGDLFRLFSGEEEDDVEELEIDG